MATAAALSRKLAGGEMCASGLLAAVEEAGLVDAPELRLRLETSRDRLIVMQFIYDCGRMKMDRGLWARMHPAEAERLVEIMPKKVDE